MVNTFGGNPIANPHEWIFSLGGQTSIESTNIDETLFTFNMQRRFSITSEL